MMARQKEALDKRNQRLEAQLKEQELKEKQEMEEYRRKRQAHLSKPLNNTELSWAQIQEAQELERRRRIEERKEELIKSAKYPGELGTHVENWKNKVTSEPPPRQETEKRTIEDPEQVRIAY